MLLTDSWVAVHYSALCMFWEYVIGSIALVSFIISLLVNRSNFRFQVSLCEVLIILYLALAVFSGIIHHSAFFTYNISRVAIPLGFGLSYIYAFSRKDWKYIIYGLMLFGMVNVVMSYWIYFSGVFNVETPFPVSALYGNRNDFAKYLSIVSVYFLIELLVQKKKGLKLFYGIFLIVIFGAILIQYSRSGYIVYFISSTAVIFLCGSKSVKRVALIILPVILALFIYFTMVRIQSDKMNIANGSDLGRLYVLRAGINMIKAHPVLGIGYGMSQTKNGEYAVKSLPGLKGLTAIHNWYVVVWAEMGILGLVVFCALNYTLMHKSIRRFFKLGLFDGKQSLFVFNSLLILVIEAFVQPISDYQDIYWIIVAIGVIDIKSEKNYQNVKALRVVEQG